MARSRLHLQELLEDILGSRGKVYFQPPENLKLQYPCIVYSFDTERTDYADNAKYRHHILYQVTYIDRDPDGVVSSKLSDLPFSVMSRTFTSNELNHAVFNLYF